MRLGGIYFFFSFWNILKEVLEANKTKNAREHPRTLRVATTGTPVDTLRALVDFADSCSRIT